MPLSDGTPAPDHVEAADPAAGSAKHADPTAFDQLRRLRDSHKQAMGEALRTLHRDMDGLALSRSLSDLTDTLVGGLFERLRAQRGVDGVALVALGGYGRAELSPASDVDLCVVYDGSITGAKKAFVESLVRALWDLGLDLGFATRTLRQSAQEMASDVITAASVLDARLLAGDRVLFRRLHTEVVRPYLADNWKKFIESKIDENVRRHEFYGDSVFLKEPNIKDNRGGLRDMHTARWIARAFRASRAGRRGRARIPLDARALALESFAFLLLARAAMHRHAGRKCDVLDMHLQHEVAGLLGYRDDAAHLAVEKFMRAYFLAARGVDRYLRAIEDLYEGRVGSITRRLMGFTMKIIPRLLAGRDQRLMLSRPIDDETLGDPRGVMDLFLAAQEHRLDLEQELLLRIRRRALKDGPRYARSPACQRALLSALAHDTRTADALSLMESAGVLAAVLPEWAEVECLVQYNAYHQYTVNEHSLRAVAAVDRIMRDALDGKREMKHDVARSLGARARTLKIALLLHDIGKAREGDHTRAGLAMIPPVLSRMGLSEEEQHLVYFLVERHMLMSDVAQRRDIGDETVVREFSSRVLSLPRLELLYLLTLADMEAVGPGTLTRWKQALLEDLFLRAQALITGEPPATQPDQPLAERVQALLDDMEPDPARRARTLAISRVHLHRMPRRYLLEVTPREALQHARMLQEAEGGKPVVHVDHGEEGSPAGVWIACPDADGRFAQLAGTLTALGADIITAQAYAAGRGRLLDRFIVSFPFVPAERVAGFAGRLAEVVAEVFDDRRDVAALIARAGRTMPQRRRYPFTASPRVVLSNQRSPRVTVVEVLARDRLGLLFELTSALAQRSLDVDFAKITTQGNVAYDTFHVTRNGKKLPPGREWNELETALHRIAAGREDDCRETPDIADGETR